MFPEAPALFSTTTGCPIERESLSATVRARMSVEPPGAHGTTSLTGLSGQAACAWRATKSSAAARARDRLIFPPETGSITRRFTNPEEKTHVLQPVRPHRLRGYRRRRRPRRHPCRGRFEDRL